MSYNRTLLLTHSEYADLEMGHIIPGGKWNHAYERVGNYLIEYKDNFWNGKFFIKDISYYYEYIEITYYLIQAFRGGKLIRS